MNIRKLLICGILIGMSFGVMAGETPYKAWPICIKNFGLPMNIMYKGLGIGFPPWALFKTYNYHEEKIIIRNALSFYDREIYPSPGDYITLSYHFDDKDKGKLLKDAIIDTTVSPGGCVPVTDEKGHCEFYINGISYNQEGKPVARDLCK
jgi:hypothetical protein